MHRIFYGIAAAVLVAMICAIPMSADAQPLTSAERQATLDARINELMVKAQNVVLAEQCHVSEWAGSAETAIVSAAGQAAVDSMLDMNAAVARMQRDIAIFRRGVTSEVGANALRDPLLTANLKREMPDFARFP
jgi:hypothetical protein